ncbi:hypothetical protein PIB30_023203 [Stylosanthes scabra]|uniref:RING-type E3 ubiquitin transferase n=1 Tax=Stylosanthes scabra TaxID=79078 RepID=A0ABU6V7P8_9FABA|nr:hypothetical protein [Stylosanthes scabra]
MVNPITQSDNNKCPICDTQFADIIMGNIRDNQTDDYAIDLRFTWMFSLYAPIFLGLMGAISPFITRGSAAGEEATVGNITGAAAAGEDDEIENNEFMHNNNNMTRRRASSYYVMHLFRGLHVRMVSESESFDNNRNMDANMVVIDPFTDAALMIFRVPNMNHSASTNQHENNNNNRTIGSFHEFLVGSGFDLLLQQLAQNGASGYGSVVNPPTKKAAIEALPSVIINEEILQCMVCLEDIEIGNEAKEMPCLHKFHSDCIMAWLKPHSSCPVCRFQMPSEDSTGEANNLEIRNDGNQNNSELVTASRRNWFPMLHSFNNFLPSP